MIRPDIRAKMSDKGKRRADVVDGFEEFLVMIGLVIGGVVALEVIGAVFHMLGV